MKIIKVIGIVIVILLLALLPSIAACISLLLSDDVYVMFVVTIIVSTFAGYALIAIFNKIKKKK